MKFFTPGRYLRFNSPDEPEADRADEDWEIAIHDYKAHLKNNFKEMPSRVRDLAENLCLHDAVLLGKQQAKIPEAPIPPLSPIPVSVLSLRQTDQLVTLIYLRWDRIAHSRPSQNWPFSNRSTHWLYDEFDLEPGRPGLFWHRILLSDGFVIAIPFFDVIMQRSSIDQPPEKTHPRASTFA